MHRSSWWVGLVCAIAGIVLMAQGQYTIAIWMVLMAIYIRDL